MTYLSAYVIADRKFNGYDMELGEPDLEEMTRAVFRQQRHKYFRQRAAFWRKLVSRIQGTDAAGSPTDFVEFLYDHDYEICKLEGGCGYWDYECQGNDDVLQEYLDGRG
jgi:hypothetical protein